MKKLIPYLFFSALLFACLDLKAQEERCTQRLEEAQLRYDEGRIQEVEGLLTDDCMQVFDKAQQVQALRLIILSALFQQEEERADGLMLQLLQTNHEFEPDQAIDPTEFINLYNTYRTKPIFNVGLHAGANTTFNDVQKVFSTGQQGWIKEYSQKFAVTVGLLFEWEFKPKWFLYPELHYSSKTYSFSEESRGLINPNSIVSTSEINESYVWFELPVSVQYVIGNNRNLQPYAFLGGTLGYLFSSEYPGDLNSRDDLTEIQLSTIESAKDRNSVSVSALAGIGVKIKLGEGFITAEGRYNYMLTQLTVDENSYSPTVEFDTNEPQDLVYGLWEPYDSFYQHTAVFMVGYTKNIYNPKKLQSR